MQKNMKRELNILKAVLLLRKFNTYQTKEEQVEEVRDNFLKGYMTDESLQEWIDSLKEDLAKTPEQLEAEAIEQIERLCEADAEQARQGKRCKVTDMIKSMVLLIRGMRQE